MLCELYALASCPDSFLSGTRGQRSPDPWGREEAAAGDDEGPAHGAPRAGGRGRVCSAVSVAQVMTGS